MNARTTLMNNLKRLQSEGEFSSNNALAKAAGTSSRTINLMTDENETTASKISVLEQVAASLGYEAWMLLIEDFPFRNAKRKRIKKISEEGYLLLHAFENAPEQVRYSIMESAATALNNSDKVASRQIREEQTRYLARSAKKR